VPAVVSGRSAARIEHLINGFTDFLVQNRHTAAMASTDPAAKRNKLDDEATTLRQRDEELREALHTTMLRTLRVPS
jgi:hypothetical protein